MMACRTGTSGGRPSGLALTKPPKIDLPSNHNPKSAILAAIAASAKKTKLTSNNLFLRRQILPPSRQFFPVTLGSFFPFLAAVGVDHEAQADSRRQLISC